VDAEGAAVAGEKFGPEVEGEVVEGGLMDAEGAPAVAPGERVVRREQRGAARGAAGRGRVVGRAFGAGSAVGQRRGYEGSSADAALEVAFGEELGIGVEDGEAGDGEFGCESAAGGDLLAGSEIAAENGVAEARVNLAVEGGVGFAIDGDDRDDAGGNVEHAGIVVAMRKLLQVVMGRDHFRWKSGYGV
jgi:hypothetical protein